MNNELVYLSAETGTIRAAGSTLIVPVVALKETVIHAVNSTEPEYVPYSTLVAAPQEWNQKPVCLGHPFENGRQISANDSRVLESHAFGIIQRARVQDRKLLMDLHIDPVKAEKIGAGRLLERLRNGEQCEVSVGAFVHTEPVSGTFNRKRYQAIWRKLTPDHIAVLEHSRGACSCHDGCGTYQRAAEQYAAIDPYAPAFAQLRASSQRTPDELFADRFRDERLAEFTLEYAATADQAETPPPCTRFAPSDLEMYAAPDPWAAGFEKLRQEYGR